MPWVCTDWKVDWTAIGAASTAFAAIVALVVGLLPQRASRRRQRELRRFIGPTLLAEFALHIRNLGIRDGDPLTRDVAVAMAAAFSQSGFAAAYFRRISATLESAVRNLPIFESDQAAAIVRVHSALDRLNTVLSLAGSDRPTEDLAKRNNYDAWAEAIDSMRVAREVLQRSFVAAPISSVAMDEVDQATANE